MKERMTKEKYFLKRCVASFENFIILFLMTVTEKLMFKTYYFCVNDFLKLQSCPLDFS